MYIQCIASKHIDLSSNLVHHLLLFYTECLNKLLLCVCVRKKRKYEKMKKLSELNFCCQYSKSKYIHCEEKYKIMVIKLSNS